MLDRTLELNHHQTVQTHSYTIYQSFFNLLYPSLRLFSYSSIHHLTHQSWTRWPFKTGLMASIWTDHSPLPRLPSTPAFRYISTTWPSLLLSNTPVDDQGSWKNWLSLFNTCSEKHEIVVKCVSRRSLYLQGSVHKKKPPNRAWSLGPVRRDNWWCFHYKVWGNMGVGAQYECVYCGGGQVDSAASSLTPTSLVLGMDESLLPNVLTQINMHSGNCIHTYAWPQRQMHTRHAVQSKIHFQRWIKWKLNKSRD